MEEQGVVDGLSRRGFLGVAAGAAMVASGLKPWRPGGPGAPQAPALVEPPRIYSRRGRLDVALVVEERECFWAGARRTAITYNGGVPGPTLVADPGDRVHVRLVNRLSQKTNLHTHGFHVAPGGNADNVMIAGRPAGETFDYEFDIPHDHPPGLNWYHPHPHGDGTRQLFGGAAARWSSVPRPSAADAAAAMRDRVLILQAPEWAPDGEPQAVVGETCCASPGALGQRPAEPARCRSKRGETERWRVVNASVSDFFDLQARRPSAHADRGRRQSVRAPGGHGRRADPAGRPGGGAGAGGRARQLRAARGPGRPWRRLRLARPRARDARRAPGPASAASVPAASRCSRRSATCARCPWTSSARSRR